MRRGSFPSAVQAALVPACLPHVAGPHRRGPWCRSKVHHDPLGPQRWIGLQKRPEMGSPPGAARSRPIKHRARDALALADLRLSGLQHASMSRGVEVRGSEHYGLRTLRKLVCAPDQMRPARPRYLRRRGGNGLRTAAYPAPIKEYGRRSVGCLKFESEMRTGEHLARFTLPLQERVKEEYVGMRASLWTLTTSRTRARWRRG